VVKAKNEDVILRASVLDSDGSTTLDAANGTVALLTAKDTDYQSIKTDSSNALWFKTRDAGHVHETVQMVKITADGGLVINAGNGVVVEYRDTGSLEDSVEVLSQQPGLEWMAQVRDRDDAVWQAVQEAHKEWDYKAEGLSGAAAAVIAIAVAIATYGAGSALVTAAVGEAAAATTMGGVAVAAAEAGIAALASQAAISMINNKGDLGAVFKDMASKETLKSLATAMVAAGLTAGVVGAINASVPADAGPLIQTGKAAGFVDRVAYQSINATVKTLTQATIGGQDIGDALKQNLMTAAVNVASSVAFEAIGGFAGSEEVNIPDGDIRKVIMHAVTGCAIGQLSSKNCMAGAIGAGLQEVAGDLLKDLAGANNVELQVKLAGLAGALATALAGGDASAVNAASTIAESAATYNRQLHTEEIKALRKLAKQMAAEKGGSEDDWFNRLGNEALSQVDSYYQDRGGDSEAAFILAQYAQNNPGFTDAVGRQFGFFDGGDQYYNHALYASLINDNADAYDSLLANWGPQTLQGRVKPSTIALVMAAKDRASDISPDVDGISRSEMDAIDSAEMFALRDDLVLAMQEILDARASNRLEFEKTIKDKGLIDQEQLLVLEHLDQELKDSQAAYQNVKRVWAQQAAIGLAEGTGTYVKEGVTELLQLAWDTSAPGMLFDDGAMVRNEQRVDAITNMVENWDEIPGAVKAHYTNRMAEADALRASGRNREAAQIEAEIGLDLLSAMGGIASLPAATKTLVSTTAKATKNSLDALSKVDNGLSDSQKALAFRAEVDSEFDGGTASSSTLDFLKTFDRSQRRFFKADEAVIHFDKHASSLMQAMDRTSYNLKDYVNDAHHVIQHGTYVPEMNGFVRLLGGEGSAKFAFVGLDKVTNNITTFHVKTASELAKKAPSLGIIK